MSAFEPLFVPADLLDAVSEGAWLEAMLEVEAALATAEAAAGILPPQVAAKRSGFSWREQVSTRPSGSISSRLSTHSLKQPATWWFLPCTSLAMAPPTVTKRVPGVVWRNQPRGRKVWMISSRLKPASQRNTPVVSSKLSMASKPRLATIRPARALSP